MHTFLPLLHRYKHHRDFYLVLAEKTGRQYRNFKDNVGLQHLDIEIHLPKEGHLVNKEPPSHDRLIHGIKVVLSRNFIENLSEGARKGVQQNTAGGIYQTCLPLDIRTIPEHTIEETPYPAAIVKRIFELFGRHQQLLDKAQTANHV